MRKAYFRMAQKYHPDKNPDGRVSQIYYTTLGLFSLKVTRFQDKINLKRWIHEHYKLIA